MFNMLIWALALKYWYIVFPAGALIILIPMYIKDRLDYNHRMKIYDKLINRK